MSNFTNIKAGLVTKISTLTDYFATGAVFNYEPSLDAIQNDPFVVIVPSENESEFESTSENMRTYAFLIRVFVERNARGEQDADAQMALIVDAIIDALDSDTTLSVSGVIFSEANPSSWGYVESDKEYRTADIRFAAKVIFDTTS